MKLKKPNFWDYKRPNIISNLLYPFSKIVSLISSSKKKWNQNKWNYYYMRWQYLHRWNRQNKFGNRNKKNFR